MSEVAQQAADAMLTSHWKAQEFSTYRMGSGSSSSVCREPYPVAGKGEPLPVMVPPGATRCPVTSPSQLISFPVKTARINSYLILCLSLYGREGRLKVSKVLSGCVVTSAEQVISTARSRNVVLRGSELVGVFSEGGTFTGKKVILRCALGLDGLSLAWKYGVSCNRADEGDRYATKWSVPSEKSSKEGKRSAILSVLRGCVSLLGRRRMI